MVVDEYFRVLRRTTVLERRSSPPRHPTQKPTDSNFNVFGPNSLHEKNSVQLSFHLHTSDFIAHFLSPLLPPVGPSKLREELLSIEHERDTVFSDCRREKTGHQETRFRQPLMISPIQCFQNAKNIAGTCKRCGRCGQLCVHISMSISRRISGRWPQNCFG
jgi:hypothetical protein